MSFYLTQNSSYDDRNYLFDKVNRVRIEGPYL